MFEALSLERWWTAFRLKDQKYTLEEVVQRIVGRVWEYRLLTACGLGMFRVET